MPNGRYVTDAPQASDDPARHFRHFAAMCHEVAPLYAELSRHVAEDPELLALTAGRQSRQPPPNILFGAVHYLLLSGAEHPLRDCYPSLGGRRPPSEAVPLFSDFCRAHRAAILELAATRRVQTNEVGRCGMLLPAFAAAWQRCERRPLYLIEVGASTGLLLQFDRYRYEYAGGSSCGPPSAARIRCELRASTSFPCVMPEVAGRVGVDIAPVDVNDDDAIRWVEAMIWADMVERIELFRRALSIARQDPPRVVAGDGLDLVPDIVASLGADVLPCIAHSHAIYQMNDAWREQFGAMLDALGARRDLARVSLEWLGDDPGPQLHLTLWRGGERETLHLAECHHHGRWIRWLG